VLSFHRERAIKKFWFYQLQSANILVLVIVMASWQFLTKTPLTVRTELTLAAFYAVLSLLEGARKNHRFNSVPPVNKKDERVFVEDPGVVLEVAKLSGYEAIRRFAPYLGKWTTIAGKYEGFAESLQKDSLHLSLLLNDGRRINMLFAVEERDRLRGLQEGQRITVLCQIQQRNLLFTPENCQLVHAEWIGRRESKGLAYA